ncbi:hypothetical protein [Collinsella sp. AF38-3AC]|uniref:hypothetical protein n=1 Tax=Collinsella sp. AF38-3AC TaxID=2292015 RepID=UPI000E47123E|nr:hypothetical protein [Collinsella sp. AF38-3AC]RHL21281.1 hypothetical protein DW029_10655 [Collinsella sp. AF38-3AC]
MPEDLEINSFDDLKAALDEALHNGGTSPDTADYLLERFDVLCVDIDNVFLSISANDIQECYPNLSLDEALEVRDNANENVRFSGGYYDLDTIAWNQIKTEVEYVQGTRHDFQGEEASLDDLAETYGEDGSTCQKGDDLRDTDGIPR